MTSPFTRTPSTSIACACHDVLPSRNRSFVSSLTTLYLKATLNESPRQLELQCSKLLSLYPQGRQRGKKMHSTSFSSAHSFAAIVRRTAQIRCCSNLFSLGQEVLTSLVNGAGVSHGKHAEPSLKSLPDAAKRRLNAPDVCLASMTPR